jgi:hypothetical protein
MMRSLVRGLALVAPLLSLACSGPSGAGGSSIDDVGSIGVALTLASGATLNSVSYQITGPTAKTGTIDLSHSTAVSAVISGLSAGGGYSITLTGTATDGTTSCMGSGSFAVMAHQTSTVTVNLDCHEGAKTGSVLVQGSINVCPTIDGISANPGEVLVGASIALQGTAHDSDNGPMPLTYQWKTTGASAQLSDPTSPAPSLTCLAAGAVTVSLTVSDGDPLPSCAATSTATVTCTPGPLQNDVATIVVIYAENRSFDGLFGRYPGAGTHGLSEVVDSTGTPTAAYHPQLDRDGVTALAKLPKSWGGPTAAGNPTVVTEAQSDNLANAPFGMENGFVANGGAPLTTTDVQHDIAHRFFENIMEINGGTSDGYAAWEDAGGITMGHWDYSHSALWAVAQQNVLADNFFQGAYGGSFLNHQYLICGCAPQAAASFVTGTGATVNVLGAPNAKGVLQLGTKMTSPPSALTGPPQCTLTGCIAPLDY